MLVAEIELSSHTDAQMRPIVVLVMLVVYAVVICESAAVAKQRRGVKPAPASAAESPTRWFPGLAFPGFAKNKRFILPSIKHHTSEQKHKRTVSRETVLMDYIVGKCIG